MFVCYYSLQLLNSDIFIVQQLLQQAGKKNAEGKTALDIYCESGADTNSEGFCKLQVEELIRSDNEINLRIVYKTFIAMNDVTKVIYAERVKVTPKKYRGHSMTQILLVS